MDLEKNSMPLHLQVYQIMLKKIMDGEWKTDDKVPPELELCKIYSVSRITIRQAMEKLKEQGYICRIQGKGSYVTVPPVEQKLNAFYSFGDRLSSKGQPVGSLILDYWEEAAGSRYAKELGIEEADQIAVLDRIRVLDNIPFAHEISRFPLKCFPGINREMIQQYGLYKSFMYCGNINPDIAEETFEAVSIGNRSAEYLHVSANSPAMKIHRVARHQDIVVEICSSIVRGDRMKYTVVMQRG